MTKKKSCAIFSGIGILFVFFCMAEHELAVSGNIIWDGGWIVKILASSLVLGIILGCLVCLGLLWLEETWKARQMEEGMIGKRARVDSEKGIGEVGRKVVGKKTLRLPGAGILFWISWGCTMACWLPGYLAYYPGIGAYDFTIQMGQVTSGMYNEHHPLFHTLLMEMFIRLGDFFGSGTLGLAIYVLFQMSILAAALAAGIALLRKRGVRRGWLIALQVFCCFYPFHWYMSISATKDTMFTGFMFLQLLMLCGLLEERGAKNRKTGSCAAAHSEMEQRMEDTEAKSCSEPHSQMEHKEKKLQLTLWDLGYFLCSVLMILFRNNGRYAMIVLAGFLLLAVMFGKKARALWTKILAETVAGIVVGSILLSAVFGITGAQQGDRREMLSMPIQQLARCMIYHGGAGVLPEDDNTMSDEDKALVNEFILHNAYKNYRPDISDPVKGNTNTYVVVHKMRDFMTTYVRLLGQYPGDYVNAVLAGNAGFLSPFDETHAYINVNGRDKGLGYIQTRWLDPQPNPFQIQRDSKWPWLLEQMEAFADSNTHMKLPMIKYLLVPGTYLWLYLVLAAWLLVHKRYRQLLPLTLILGYYATLFLGPTVQMRYLYPVMTALPYLAVWLVSSKSGKNTVL